jgi:hypothetical protein
MLGKTLHFEIHNLRILFGVRKKLPQEWKEVFIYKEAVIIVRPRHGWGDNIITP